MDIIPIARNWLPGQGLGGTPSVDPTPQGT